MTQLGATCPKCGSHLTPEAAFCHKCGTKLQPDCPNCGQQAVADADYCPKCGTRLKGPPTKTCADCGKENSATANYCRGCGRAFGGVKTETPGGPLKGQARSQGNRPMLAQAPANPPGEGFSIPSSIADNLPSMVRSELTRLPIRQQDLFLEEFRRKAKSSGMAYFLWFFFGCQYAYLGNWGIQILYWFTLGGLGLWAFIDLFRIAGMVRNYNKDVAVDVLRSMSVMTR